jgi:hypothetical protein
VTTPSTDAGFWSGSITYQASYMGTPLVISIGTGPDANGIDWIWQGIQGWDSPDVAGAVMQRGADQGGWATGQWYAPRALTLSLRASCPNWATRDLARSILQQAIPVNDLCMLQYNEPIPKQIAVRRSGQIVETSENLQEVTFACVLIAPDPRKYSTVLKQWSAASITPTNYLSITNGSGYTAQAQFFSTTAWATGTAVAISWYTSGLTFISTTTGTITALAANTWSARTLSVSAANVPATAAYASISVLASGTPTAGQLFYVSTAILANAQGGQMNLNSLFETLGDSSWNAINSATIGVSSAQVFPGTTQSLTFHGNGTVASPGVQAEDDPFGGQTTIPFTLPSQSLYSSATNTNAGNFETRPIVQVVGPIHAPGLRLVNTGQAVTWSSLVLNSGDQLIVDFDAKMAWKNGIYVAADIRSAWWDLPPGLNTVQLLTGASVSTDQGIMLVQHRDAWI